MLTSNKETKRVSSIKFLGMLLYENFSWKDYIRVIQNKISKNVSLLYKAKRILSVHAIKQKRILNVHALKFLYFSFRHNYLNYGNIGRASSTWTKQKKLASNEKQAIRIIDSECYDIREKMSEINILNIHKINIY